MVKDDKKLFIIVSLGIFISSYIVYFALLAILIYRFDLDLNKSWLLFTAASSLHSFSIISLIDLRLKVVNKK